MLLEDIKSGDPHTKISSELSKSDNLSYSHRSCLWWTRSRDPHQELATCCFYLFFVLSETPPWETCMSETDSSPCEFLDDVRRLFQGDKEESRVSNIVRHDRYKSWFLCLKSCIFSSTQHIKHQQVIPSSPTYYSKITSGYYSISIFWSSPHLVHPRLDSIGPNTSSTIITSTPQSNDHGILLCIRNRCLPWTALSR